MIVFKVLILAAKLAEQNRSIWLTSHGYFLYLLLLTITGFLVNQISKTYQQGRLHLEVKKLFLYLLRVK